MATFAPYLWAAFNSLVGDPYYKYTDLTPWVREDVGAPYATRRGRQDVTQKFNTGRGTYMLDNRDRRFESLNPAGPYYGNLTPMVPVQSGVLYPWLPGIIANSDLRTRVGVAAWVNVSGGGSVSYTAPASKMDYGSFTMTNTNGGLGHQDVLSGTTAIPASRVGSALGWGVRATNTGTGTITVARIDMRFYSDAAGTTLISQVTGSPQIIRVGEMVNLQGNATIPATTVCMRMLMTITVPLTANALTFTCLAADYISGGFMGGPHYTGYSDSWNCQWDVGDNVCTLACSDAFKPLGLSPLSTPLYGSYLATLANVKKWYRLNETVSSQHDVLGVAFKDQVSGLGDAHVWTGSTEFSTAPGYRNAGPLAGVAGAAPVDNDLAFSFVGPSSRDGGAIALPATVAPSSTNWSVAFWYRATNGITPYNNAIEGTLAGTNADRQILNINRFQGAVSDDVAAFGVWLTANGYIQALVGKALSTTQGSGDRANLLSNTPSPFTAGQNICVDALWHRLWFTYNGTTNTLKVYIDGLLDHTEPQISGTPVVFGANAQDTTGKYPSWFGHPYVPGTEANRGGGVVFGETDELMFFNAEVSAGIITTDYQRAKLVYPIQTTSARVGAILDNVNWPAGMRNITPGLGVQVTDLRKPFYQANPLQYLQQVEDTEVGMLFTDMNGRVTFVDVASMETLTSRYATSVATFGTGASEIPYENIITRNEDSTLYTRATAAREGGATQTFDAANQPRYLLRSIDKNGLLLSSDEKAYNVAQYNGALFSVPGTKLQSIVYNPYADETTALAFLSLDLGDAITVRLRPPGITPGTYYEVACTIQGINTDISRGKARCTLSVSSIYSQRWMQFGDNFSTFNMGI